MDLQGGGVSLLGGQAEPPDRFSVVRRHAFAGAVPDSEVVLRVGVSLLGGQAVPPDGFSVVLRHAFAGAVRKAEVVLGSGFSLLGGQVVPPDRFSVLAQEQEPEESDLSVLASVPTFAPWFRPSEMPVPGPPRNTQSVPRCAVML